jgi:hypothetical protein
MRYNPCSIADHDGKYCAYCYNNYDDRDANGRKQFWLAA